MGYIITRFVYGRVIKNVSVSLDILSFFFTSLFKILTDFFYPQAGNRTIRFGVKVEGIEGYIS